MPRNSITGKVTTPYNLTLEEMNEERSLISHIQANYDDLNEVVNNCLDLQGTKQMRNNINMNNYNIKKAQEGTEASQLATVSQVRKGKFGVDKSTSDTTIDLEESPASTNEYTDGLIITFKATKNSVNNMTLQINSLGYKELDKEQVGIGSFVKDDIVKVLYNKDTDKFVSLNDKNQTINYYGVVADFNDLITPIKAMVTIDSTTKNMPDSSTLSKYKLNALLEVNKKYYNRNNTINARNYMCEVQTLAIYGNDKYTIGTWSRERFKGVWQSWKKLVFINNNVDHMIMLAKAGTRNGDFKIRTDKNNQGTCYWHFATNFGSDSYKGKYYSGFVFNNMKDYQNTPQLDTNLWFYININMDYMGGVISQQCSYVGYLINDFTSVEWLKNEEGRGWTKIDGYFFPIPPWDDSFKTYT